MTVEIISPDKKLFEGNATSVQLPGTEGSFQVLNNHAPIIIGTIEDAIEKGKKIISEAK